MERYDCAARGSAMFLLTLAPSSGRQRSSHGGTLPRHFAHFAALAIGFNASHGRLQVQPLCAAPLLRFWQFCTSYCKRLAFFAQTT